MKPRRKLPRAKTLDDRSSIPANAQPGAQIATTAAESGSVVYVLPEQLKKSLATIATNAWKARCRMMDPTTGEACNQMKRVCGDIERIERCLNDIGIVVEDHTNKPFDYGLPWNVIATRPVPGISKEIVTETLRPTVRWNEHIIQHAEVEIGTPMNAHETA